VQTKTSSSETACDAHAWRLCCSCAPEVERGSSDSVNARSSTSFAAEVVDQVSPCDPHGTVAAGGRFPSVGGWPELVAGSKACQLARNDARPKRWVVLHANTKPGGGFAAGADCSCRQELLETTRITKTRVPPIVPVDAGSGAEARPQLQLEDKSAERKPNGCCSCSCWQWLASGSAGCL